MKLRNQLIVSALLMTVGFSVMAGEASKFKTKLTGFQETPAILSGGSGTFQSKLDKTGTSLSYTLTFSGLSSPATVAHIHFGQSGVAGGVIAFLCGGGGKPACPPAGGTVTGTIVAADILAIPAQEIMAGNFENFLIVIGSNNAYVNVHTVTHPGGEIRGQIKQGFPLTA